MKKIILTTITLLIFNIAYGDVIHIDGTRSIATSGNITIIKCKYSDACCVRLYIPFDFGMERVKVYLPEEGNCLEETFFEAKNVHISNEPDQTVLICELP